MRSIGCLPINGMPASSADLHSWRLRSVISTPQSDTPGVLRTWKSIEAAAATALQAGQLTEAAGYLERLAAAGDDDTDAHLRHLDRLSYVYEKMGHTRNALEVLARLPKTAQSRPEIVRREAVL